MGLEKLVEFYKGLVADNVQIVETGKPIRLQHFEEDKVLYQAKFEPTPEITAQHSFVETRARCLLEQLYVQLRDIYSTEEVLFKRVRAAVQDPLLDTAFELWGVKEKEGKKITKDEFIQGFIDNKRQLFGWKTSSYVRPMVFLEVLRKHPDKFKTLEDNATFFVNVPFKLVYKTQGELKKELNRTIAINIASLFSAELVQKIGEITKYVGKEAWNPIKGIVKHVGGYSLRDFTFYNFITSDPEAAQKLESLYEPIDVKRELFETLAYCFKMVGKTAGESGFRVKDTAFKIAPSEFGKLAATLDAYAGNQIAYVWRKSDGAVIPQTTLGRLRNAVARIERLESGSQLRVSFGRNSERIYSFDGGSANTTARLPFCVYALHRLYTIAQDILREIGETKD